MSSLQNLGSVINTAFSVQGDRLLMDYVNQPDLVPKALREHYAVDAALLAAVSAGRRLAADGRLRGRLHRRDDLAAAVCGDQCSQGPAADRLCPVDRGTDSWFTRIPASLRTSRTMPGWSTCRLSISGRIPIFERIEPVAARRQGELHFVPLVDRVARAGGSPRGVAAADGRSAAAFQACTFTCLEIDTKLDGDLIFAFCETFRRCAEEVG